MYYGNISEEEKTEVVTLLINEFVYDLNLFQLAELDEVLGTNNLMIEKIVVDNIIVSVVLYTIDIIENRKWTYIEYICTKAGHKNLGYATALIRRLPQPIYLHVVKSEYTTKLLQWYTRNNFTILRETPSKRSYLLSSLVLDNKKPSFGEWDL